MEQAHQDHCHAPPWGFLVGCTQAAIWWCGMTLGSLAIFSGVEVHTSHHIVLLLGITVAIVVGVLRDTIGAQHYVGLSLPRAARTAVVFASAAPWLVFVASEPGGWCAGLIGWALLAITIDGLLGPTKTLWDTLTRCHSRRTWTETEVLSFDADTDMANLRDSHGEAMRVRCLGKLLELGPAYVSIQPATTSYRDSGSATLCDYESAKTRRLRRLMVNASLLAILSGLGWVAVWLSPWIGRATCTFRQF